jgi:uncharacterized membrane protein YbaN (DUF454 family)
MRRRLILAVTALLLAGAAFELALALGAAKPGPQPGDDAAGEAVVAPVMAAAVLVGMVVAAAARDRIVAALAPAAGLLLVAGYYTYDPYYAPTLRRYSDGGAAAPSAIFAVLAIMLVVGVIAFRWPRVGGPLTAFALFVCGFTAVIAGDGH